MCFKTRQASTRDYTVSEIEIYCQKINATSERFYPIVFGIYNNN